MSQKTVNSYRFPSGFEGNRARATRVVPKADHISHIVHVVQAGEGESKPIQKIIRSRPKETPSMNSMEKEENELLRREIATLRLQLHAAEDSLEQHRKREQELKDRLTKEMQQTIRQGGKFEDLSLGALRPTQLIEQYQILYTQGRLDALDELDEIEELSYLTKGEEVKEKILMGLMVASYRVAKDYAEHIRKMVSGLLCLQDTSWSRGQGLRRGNLQVDVHIDNYLQAGANQFDIAPIVQEVKDQLQAAVPELHDISKYPALTAFVCECGRIAWALCNQIPPMEIEFSNTSFSHSTHTRFHRANTKNFSIKMYVWPTLLDSSNKNVLFRGVVVT